NEESPKPKHTSSQAQRELAAKQAHIDDLEAARAHEQGLAEQLQAAKIEIVGLKSEVEELKDERNRLCERVADLGNLLATSTPRTRGRPKGSKNKPKSPPEDARAPRVSP